LLFANAGMNQFKDVFLGLETRLQSRSLIPACVRAASTTTWKMSATPAVTIRSSRCWATSFGNYFKAEAIDYAWTLLTKDYGLPEKLYITVFREDDEAVELWQKVAESSKVASSDWMRRIIFVNGRDSPCGPCSEIHYDLGPEAAEPGRENEAFPSDAGGRYVEL
jgi:alanyl-tRNA synthetase